MTDRLPKGTVLDVAAGSGRHSLYLGAQPGYHVEAVDREENALAALRDAAHEQNILSITTRVVDLENPRQPAEFGTSRYDVILVFFYLYRPLMPALLRALAPGGMLVYETFLADNHLRYGHPRRREFCLESNELLRLASGLRVLHYDEGRHGDAGHGSHDAEGAITAQLLAVKNP
jgi:SAM-dependent methyltransferase